MKIGIFFIGVKITHSLVSILIINYVLQHILAAY